jgi:hypothetical protein
MQWQATMTRLSLSASIGIHFNEEKNKAADLDERIVFCCLGIIGFDHDRTCGPKLIPIRKQTETRKKKTIISLYFE